MDDVARYNIERWKALTEADVLFARPLADTDVVSARRMLDPDNRLGDFAGKRVLCLAGGGGQQSVAFASLGADVTVFDLSEQMLERDREIASRLGLNIKVVQGDMRDLSTFPEDSFDIVWHPYSLNFVPDARAVFGEVACVIRNEGLYYFNCANPFFSGLTEEDWNGEGYLLKRPYVEGEEIDYKDAPWVYDRGKYTGKPIPGPREYRHTLGTLVNGLIERGFLITRISEQQSQNVNAQATPGTWDHFTAIAPPWLAFWAVYRPDIMRSVADKQRAKGEPGHVDKAHIGDL